MCADMEKMLKNVKKESHKHISTHFIQKCKKGHISVSVNEVDESRAYRVNLLQSEVSQKQNNKYCILRCICVCVCVCVCV